MNKRQSLILKYFNSSQTRFRLLKDHLQAELLGAEESSDSTETAKADNNVADTLQTYKFYLKEINLQLNQIEQLIKELEEKE